MCPCRVTRGKAPFGVERQTEIFAKSRNIIRITGLVSVARCLNRHFLVLRSTKYFSIGFLYNVCFDSVYAALEFEIIVVLSVMKYRKYVFASNI